MTITSSLVVGQEWSSIGPTGGRISSLAINASGQVVGGEENLLFAADDTTNSWRLIHNAPGRGLSVSGTTLYRTGSEIAYRSTDAGTSWQALTTLPEFLFDPMAVDPTTPTTLFAATQDNYIRHLFKSVDGGATWRQVRAGLPEGDYSYHYTVLFDASRPQTLFLGSDIYGVFRSVDGGETWAAANDGLHCPGYTQGNFKLNCLSSLAVAANGTLYAGVAYDGGLYRSDDGAQTWQAVAPQLSHLQVDDLAINASGDVLIAIATTPPPTQEDGTRVPPEPHVFLSDDRGDSFSLANDGLPDDGLNALAIDPTRAGVFYAATDRGAFRSVDAGRTWEATNAGLNTSCVYGLAISSATGSLHALGGGRYWRKPSGSAEWQEGDISITDPVYGRLPVGNYERSGIVAQPNGTLYAYELGYGPFTSSDDGQTWVPRFGSDGPYGAFDLAVDPKHAGTVYIATNYSQILRSRDVGAHWEHVLDTGGGTPGSVLGVAVDAHSGRVFALYEHALFASDNGGDSWNRVGDGRPDAWHLLVAPTEPATLLSVQRINGLMVSRNHGQRWHTADVPAVYDAERYTFGAAVDPDDPRVVYTASSRLFRSDDAGTNWQPAGEPLVGVAADLKIDPANPDVMYAATCGAGVQTLTQLLSPTISGADSDGCAIGPADTRSAWPLAPICLLALLILVHRLRSPD